jgi:hypothetical protein
LPPRADDVVLNIARLNRTPNRGDKQKREGWHVGSGSPIALHSDKEEDHADDQGYEDQPEEGTSEFVVAGEDDDERDG